MNISAPYPDLFQSETTLHLHQRLDKLSTESKSKWGKMNVAQMLSHCCMPYKQALEGGIGGAPFFMKLLVKWFFKKSMVNEVPYKQNLPTNPNFVIADQKVFEEERNKLKNYILQFESKGRDYFEGKEQSTIGKLSATEWNAMMFKHIDHHLRQFGV